jgi:hypothetical protein
MPSKTAVPTAIPIITLLHPVVSQPPPPPAKEEFVVQIKAKKARIENTTNILLIIFWAFLPFLPTEMKQHFLGNSFNRREQEVLRIQAIVPNPAIRKSSRF